MSTVVLEPSQHSTQSNGKAVPVAVGEHGTKPRRFSKDEYYRLTEAGYFAAQRVQLLGGEIVEMAAQSNWHASVIKATEIALIEAFGANYWVRVQNSLDLSPVSVPDPDLAVIEGSHLTANRENPTTALLVVEVSETTLSEDRGRKVGIYAAAGIAEYWIVNIRDLRLEVRTRPQADPSQEFGFAYANLRTMEAEEFVTPLALPEGKIRVHKLFPMLPPSD